MTIIVHTVEQAIDALEAAKDLNTPVTLQSDPDAIFYAGALYILHMFAYASQSCPGARARFVIDTADSEAEALAALQIGHRCLRSSAPEEVQARLAEACGQYGAELLRGEDKSLDLQNVKDVKLACREWLKNEGKEASNESET